MLNRLFILLIGIAFVGCGNSEYSESPKVMGDILQVWEGQGADKKYTYYLVKKELGLSMITVSPLSGDYNPGEQVSGKRIENGIRYDNGQGEYYISKPDGDLILYGRDGEKDRAVEVNIRDNYQMFPSMNAAIKCPCKLQVDSNSMKELLQDSLPVVAYSCEDGNGDSYVLNALLTVEEEFSEEEMIHGIIQSIDSNKSVSYELARIDNRNAIVVNSPPNNSKMLTLFTEKSTIGMIVSSSDSLDAKFDNYLNSFIRYY